MQRPILLINTLSADQPVTRPFVFTHYIFELAARK